MDCSLEDHGIETLVHESSGSVCQVHTVGATILSFHPSPDKYSEVLFVSEDAVLNGTKAIRGGIPLVFPIFGPSASDSDMPQHGFARTNAWKVDKASLADSKDNGAVMELTLTVDAADDSLASRGTKGLWAPSEKSPACELRYRIVLKADSLTTTLQMKNTGSVAFPVQALFHTYYEVHNKAALDPTKCSVTGLKGYEMVDKVNPEKSTKATTEEVITISQEVDRVYHPPSDKPEVQVTLQLNRATETPVICTAKGSVDGQQVPVSCVVWNPHQEKAQKMSDFGSNQYHEMICVEPGILGTDNILDVGKQAILEQTIALSTAK